MKPTLSIVLLSVFLINTYSTYAQKAENNDLVRYGLKGKVKTMQQVVFPLCRKVNGMWLATDTPYYTVKLYKYNKEGILQWIEEKHIDNKTQKIDHVTTKILYKEGKLIGSEWYDEKGKKEGESTVTWKNEFSYVDIVDNKQRNIKIETHHLLDNNYRNKVTQMKKFSWNGLETNLYTTYTYEDGVLIKQSVTDSTRNYSVNYVVEILKKEYYGNAAENVMHTDPYKEDIPAVITFCKYEYYDQ